MKLWHRHHWVFVAAQRGVERNGAEWQNRDITVALYKCECGNHKVETLTGHWTAAELTV